jgi:DNA-binding SARP family transcriptional activator
MDSSEDRAGAALRTALWRLGRAAEDLVRCRGATLALADGVSVDVRYAVARAQRLIARPDEHCPQDVELLGTRGELLPDWYEDWVLIERERFAELRLRALETLCGAFTSVGLFAEAAQAGLAAVACEPLRETANRALVAAYLAEGNKAQALRHYRHFRAVLSDALQMEPSERMEMLVASVRQDAEGGWSTSVFARR